MRFEGPGPLWSGVRAVSPHHMDDAKVSVSLSWPPRRPGESIKHSDPAAISDRRVLRNILLLSPLERERETEREREREREKRE